MLLIISHRRGAFAFVQDRALFGSITYRFDTVFAHSCRSADPVDSCSPDAHHVFSGLHSITFTCHRDHQMAIEAIRFHSTHSRTTGEGQTPTRV